MRCAVPLRSEDRSGASAQARRLLRLPALWFQPEGLHRGATRTPCCRLVFPGRPFRRSGLVVRVPVVASGRSADARCELPFGSAAVVPDFPFSSAGPSARRRLDLLSPQQSAEAGWRREVSSRLAAEAAVPRGCRASRAEAPGPASSSFAAHCAGGRGAKDWTVTLPTRWLTAPGCYESIRARGLAGPLEEAVEALHSGTGLGQSLRPKPRFLRPPPSAGWLSCPAEAVRGRFPGGRLPVVSAEAGTIPGRWVRRAVPVPAVAGPCVPGVRLRPVFPAEAGRLGAAPSLRRPRGRSPLVLQGWPVCVSCRPKPAGSRVPGSLLAVADAAEAATSLAGWVPRCLRGCGRSRRLSGRSGFLSTFPVAAEAAAGPAGRVRRGIPVPVPMLRPFPQDCARGRGSRVGAG